MINILCSVQKDNFPKSTQHWLSVSTLLAYLIFASSIVSEVEHFAYDHLHNFPSFMVLVPFGVFQLLEFHEMCQYPLICFYITFILEKILYLHKSYKAFAEISSMPFTLLPLTSTSHITRVCLSDQEINIGIVLLNKLQALFGFQQLFHNCPFSVPGSNQSYI